MSGQSIENGNPGAHANMSIAVPENASLDSFLELEVVDPGDNLRVPQLSDIQAIPSLRSFIYGSRMRRWKTVPWEDIGTLVLYAANELDVPPSMMTSRNLSSPLPSLEGKHLGGIYIRTLIDHERGEKEPLAFLNERLGLTIEPADIIRSIRKGNRITWSDIPLEAQRDLLQYWAEAFGKPASMLRAQDLLTPAEMTPMLWASCFRKLIFKDQQKMLSSRRNQITKFSGRDYPQKK